MTDNNIIELTPFRADLARSLTRRGERLLAATDLAEEVAALEPLEAYYIVREMGLDQALPILRELSHEQLQACLDLDCWNRYDFSAENLEEWLAPFAAIDGETLAQTFLSLEYVLQLLFLTKSVTVYDPDADQIPPEDETRETTARAMTPDGFYLLELKNPDLAYKVHPFALLDAMYQYDPTATHRLLSEVRVDLPTQIEEEALHFRSSRMQDMGFATPIEATALFSKPPTGKPLPRPQDSLDSAVTRLPSVYAAPLTEATLLLQGLSLTDPKILSRLEQELVWAINSAIMAYGEKPQDIEHITTIVTRVRDTISLGLESLLAQEEPPCKAGDASAPAKAAELLDIWPMTDLFRHGYAATTVLQDEVKQALAERNFADWYNLADTEQSDEPADRLERAFVAGLLGRQPLRGGFDPGNAETIRAFASLAEVAAALARLKRLVGHFSGKK